MCMYLHLLTQHYGLTLNHFDLKNRTSIDTCLSEYSYQIRTLYNVLLLS